MTHSRLQEFCQRNQILSLAFALLIHNKLLLLDCGIYHYRREVVSVQLKSKVGLTLTRKAAATLRITLNLDGDPIISRTHTHPSHSETSRLLTSSLSLGVPVPRSTQCM
jgi:hypothetical protein